MDLISNILKNSEIKKLLEAKEVGNSNLVNNCFLFYLTYTLGENVFIVTKSTEEAYSYYKELSKYLDNDLYLFLEEDSTFATYANTFDFLADRIRLLTEIFTKDNKKIVITNYLAFYQKRLNPAVFKENIYTIGRNSNLTQQDLLNLLRYLGYEKSYLIEKSLQYSFRGDIVDLFPLFSDSPIRIVFDFDEISELYYFNLTTKLKEKKIDSFCLTPASDLFYDDDRLKECLFYLESNLDESDYEVLADSLKRRLPNTALNKYINFLADDSVSIFTYLKAKTYFIDKDEIDLLVDLKHSDQKDLNYLTIFDQPYTNLVAYKKEVNFFELQLNYFYHNYQNILAHLKINANLKKFTIISANNHFLTNLKTDFDNNNIPLSNFYFTSRNLPSFNSETFEVLNEENLFSKDEIKKKKKISNSLLQNSVQVTSEEDLAEGDYVIHQDYGIGQYLGLKTITRDNVSKDYLAILYYGDDHLYVPIEQIYKISKYRDSFVDLTLSPLDPKKWRKIKEKARAKIKAISNELLSLYAKRKNSPGFAFLPNDDDTLNFLNAFPYIHTKDQLKAIADITADMEASYPMERLLIGDVGYGKTEVAMNAVFKALQSLKQVAILAPTTILVNQHFKTFKERFSAYPFKISFLNRFTKDVKSELEALSNGTTDIIIGTHRLLSNDVIFKDLGLLIIDEEQRFGVKHKERIKELKTNVDTLSMSATPIPRTLAMTLSGIKDLSIIKTPPPNRHFVETYVLKRTDKVIYEAIMREINRGGQVFYLYNHIDTILEMEEKLRSLIPSLQIGVVHGRLTSKELEERISAFIDQKTNCLLCTTIIETGIDIPNANTLIIHDADTLGLAQLYQLRGRVGRSERHAYSYFLYSPAKILTDQATKRLQAIAEYQDLGSGYKIAYMDLTIRGGGNILGSEQSGFIDDIGVDLYLKLLDEELNHSKLIESSFKFLNTSFSSNYIPRSYIEDSTLRLNYHKRILALISISEKTALLEELTDIFGKVPFELVLYINEVLFKKILEEFSFIDYQKNASSYCFLMSEEVSSQINGALFFTKLQDFHQIDLVYEFKQIKLTYHLVNNDLNQMFLDVFAYLDSLRREKWHE